MGEARRVQTHLVAHQGPRRERRCHQTSHTEKAARLDEIAATLAKHPEIKSIRIEGHTDNRGSDAYNLKLSDARAASVRQYMIEKGLTGDRLLSEGFGESKPIKSNRTKKGRAKNRRVEFVIVEREGCKRPEK